MRFLLWSSLATFCIADPLPVDQLFRIDPVTCEGKHEQLAKYFKDASILIQAGLDSVKKLQEWRYDQYLLNRFRIGWHAYGTGDIYGGGGPFSQLDNDKLQRASRYLHEAQKLLAGEEAGVEDGMISLGAANSDLYCSDDPWKKTMYAGDINPKYGASKTIGGTSPSRNIQEGLFSRR